MIRAAPNVSVVIGGDDSVDAKEGGIIMTQFRRSELTTAQDGYAELIDDKMDAVSRRSLLRRLAALGLIAASGTALASLDAEGKGKRRNKNESKNKTRGKQHDRKQNQHERGENDEQPEESEGGEQDGSTEPGIGFMATEGRRGKAWTAPSITGVLNGRSTTYPVLSIPTVTSNPNILVTVSGYFTVSSTDLSQMRSGLQYALTCAIKEQHGSSPAHCFTFTEGGVNEAKLFGTAYGTTTGRKFFSFSQVVPRSWLNKDTARNDPDEVYGQVYVYGRQTSSNGWFALATRNTQLRTQRY